MPCLHAALTLTVATRCAGADRRSFLIAGRDTTACALSWMFYTMNAYPKQAEPMFEEIDRVAADLDVSLLCAASV